MRSIRAQAALDFMTSYGMVILVIAVTVYVVFQLGVFNYSVAPQYCYSTSSLSCVAYVFTANTAVLTVSFYQNTGGTLNITGAACAIYQNKSKIGPTYGNINLLPYRNPNNALYYPDNSLQGGLLAYSGSTIVMKLYCYNAAGKAINALGTIFTGYIWLNYSYSNLPSNKYTVQQVLSLSVRGT